MRTIQIGLTLEGKPTSVTIDNQIFTIYCKIYGGYEKAKKQVKMYSRDGTISKRPETKLADKVKGILLEEIVKPELLAA